MKEVQYEVGSYLTLPSQFIEARFEKVLAEVENRWNAHADSFSFPKYELNRSEESIKEEYREFDTLRQKLHTGQIYDEYNFLGKGVEGIQYLPYQSEPDFLIAQDLLANHRYRQPCCISFEHSKADSSYNCSCIEINGRKFFALEGPTEKTLENFYKLLINWNAKMLVNLTDDCEGILPKCYPYWKGTVSGSAEEPLIRLPIENGFQCSKYSWTEKEIPFLHIPNWNDHSGFNVRELIEAADTVRKRVDIEEGILAIHCSAGVGRTGTFLAVVVLLDEIDAQLERGVSIEDIHLSIPELFLKLNFFRRYTVAKEPQYMCLYRSVDLYINQLKQNQNKLINLEKIA